VNSQILGLPFPQTRGQKNKVEETKEREEKKSVVRRGRTRENKYIAVSLKLRTRKEGLEFRV